MADRRRSKTRPATAWAGIFLTAVVGIALGGAAGVATGFVMRPEDISEAEYRPALPDPLPFLSWDELSSDMTLLVMGVDATGEGGRGALKANSDTMILMRLSPTDGKIYAISIPRDTRVPVPGHGTFKVNAATAWGGPDLAATTVSNFLDVPIHKYVLVSLDGVIQAIDAIGGIDATVPKAMNYDDFAGRLHIHLKAGPQHLTGRQVESFLRFRHDSVGSDVARVQRQQGFMMEAGRQFLKPGVILRLPELWSIIKEHADTNLSAPEMLRIARWARHLDAAKDITMTVLPGDYAIVDGLSYWLPKPAGTEAFLNAHFRDPASRTEVLAEDRRPRVAIWDATGQRKSTKALKEALRRAGYQVWSLDRRKVVAKHTRIIVQRGDVEGGRELAAAMGIEEVFGAAVGDLNVDYTLELGTDWEGPPADEVVNPDRKS